MKALPFIIEYLLLLLPLLVHLAVDYKGIVRHWLNAIYVLLLSVLVGFFLPGYFWQGAFYALTLHFVFFDPFHNKIHPKELRQDWLYHGSPNNPSRSLTDKLWSKYAPVVSIFRIYVPTEIPIRLWFLSVGIGVYYHLDWIIGN